MHSDQSWAVFCLRPVSARSSSSPHRVCQRGLGAMDKSTVFSKSGKGLLEIKSKSNRLSKDEFRVLNLVDGRVSLQDLVEKSRIALPDLRKILGVLSDGGLIKELTTPGGAPATAGQA